jgi:nucleoside-diphosphate-sugar epimerase
MRALITGCAGFIGSHLSERLLGEGWEVLGVDCFNENYGRRAKLENLREAQEWDAFEFVPIDLSRGDLADLVVDCDVVLHLAAEPGVRPSWGERFGAYLRNNVIATQHLLDALIESSPSTRLVYTSSSSIYGTGTPLPAEESARPAPFSPYGVTKLAAEHLCQAYHENHGLPVVTLRYFSVYGPRQRPDMAFHRFCRAALLRDPIHVYGDGMQSRDFTYVSDVVEATTVATVRGGIEGGIFNIGAGAQVTVRDALALIERFAGYGLEISFEGPQPGDVRHTAAETAAAASRLGFLPQQSFEEGLRTEFEWLAARHRSRPTLSRVD